MQHPHSSHPDRFAFHCVVHATNGDDYVNPIAARASSVGALVSDIPFSGERAASFNRFDHETGNTVSEKQRNG